ncbi:MAG: aminotransferase class I/II-fold pyridoxal phosphate-dependent enzyme, partial [Polynucleobacter sp.]|nr:aminotransferase class I/II-fold pyridoxal phosphate-dependent enzyme [Polynucleobacter sp.]
MSQVHFQSKFPQIGTTIFTVMSTLAKEHQAINLGQGFPDFSCDPKLLEAVENAMRNDHNQYPPMTGIPELRQKISQKIERLYGAHYDPDTEITVTAGATQAILTVVLAVVRPNEEVVVIEPVYDSYIPAIDLAGGKLISVKMIPQKNAEGLVEKYVLPWDDLAKAINSNTRLVMINSPHNPTGMVWQTEDLNRLAELVRPTNALICSDEVYEHIIFDDRPHISIMTLPDMRARTVRIGSAGKSFSLTGWKVGYITAAPELMKPIAKTHQFMTFTTPPNLQWGAATGLRMADSYYSTLAS